MDTNSDKDDTALQSPEGDVDIGLINNESVQKIADNGQDVGDEDADEGDEEQDFGNSGQQSSQGGQFENNNLENN